MKSIFITRNITLQREGQEDVVLQKGHHTVADDVAEHPFVKHHVASVTDAGEGVADLQAQLEQTRIAAAAEIEQLQAQLAAAQGDAKRHIDVARMAADDLRKAHQDLATAQATIAEQQTTLAAYAAMTPAADTKAKK